jgi:hypothetical protein
MSAYLQNLVQLNCSQALEKLSGMRVISAMRDSTVTFGFYNPLLPDSPLVAARITLMPANCGFLSGNIDISEQVDKAIFRKVFKKIFTSFAFKVDYSSILINLTVKQYKEYFDDSIYKVIVNDIERDTVIVIVPKLKAFYL